MDHGAASANDLPELRVVFHQIGRVLDLVEQGIVGEQAMLVDPALLKRMELPLRRR